MADKITLTNLVNLQNENTAVNAINNNNAALTTAIDNTLSRDGTAPNQMGANFDMNSWRILNLPSPLSGDEPLRLTDASILNGGGTIGTFPIGGTAGQALVKNSATDFDVSWLSTTTGSVVFGNATNGLTQDNTQLFWDDTLKSLQIGTNNYSGNLQGGVAGLWVGTGTLTVANGNTNMPSTDQGGVHLGMPWAKNVANPGGHGTIKIFSNDAFSGPLEQYLQGTIQLHTDPTGSLRRLIIQTQEPNVAFRNITLNEFGGNVGVGTNNPTSLFQVASAFTVDTSGNTAVGGVLTATSPVFVTPLLGTPTSGVLTNCTGTASGLTAGHVTTNANLTGDVTSVGNATTLTNAPVIAKVLTGYTSGAGTISAADSILSAIQKLNGNDATNANLTGDVTSVGNATTLASVATAGTTGSSTAIPVVTINAKGLTTGITTAAVIAPAGTLSGTTLASGVTASSLTSFGSSIALGTPASGTLTNCTIPASALTGTTLASGVVTSSLTSVGTLGSLTVTGNLTGGLVTATANFLSSFYNSPGTMQLQSGGSNTAAITTSALIHVNAVLTQGTGGIGYSTGAGGTVTQLTGRTTGVTINKTCGAITLFAAAPAVGTWVSFTVTNSTVAATDIPHISFKSGTNTYIGHVSAVGSGSFQITFTSASGTTSDSPVINFSIIKGVTS